MIFKKLFNNIIYINVYIIEKLNVSEIKIGNTCSIQRNDARWDFSIHQSSQF